MLPKAHRLTRADEFRTVMRGGRRRGGVAIVTHVLSTDPAAPARFGFVVSKAVGGAVTRNLVKRRLREASADAVRGGLIGRDVVVRALPPAAAMDFTGLSGELRSQLGVSA